MKKLIAHTLVTMAACNTATAAGIYDGIYQLTGSQEYYSVHQTGTGMIAGRFIVSNSNGSAVFLLNGQRFVIPFANFWDLYSGTASVPTAAIPTVTANLTGEIDGGACNASINIVFSAFGASFTHTSYTQTAAGITQTIDCIGILNRKISLNGGSSRFNLTRIR